MHPIEHLRYLARADGIDVEMLVEEAAQGLAGLEANRPEMVAACRRLLAQQPATGALWDLAARLVTSAEPRAEAYSALKAIRTDRTAERTVARLPDDATIAVVPGSSHFISAFGRRGDLRVGVLDIEGRGSIAERRLLGVDVRAGAVDPARAFSLVAGSEVVVLEALALGPGRALVDPGAGVLAALAVTQPSELWMVVPAGCRVRSEYWAALQARAAPDWEYVALEHLDRIGFAGEVYSPDDLPVLEQPSAPELLVGLD